MKAVMPALGVIILAIVAWLFFFPDDFQGNVLQQHDVMQGIANGQEAKAYYEATGHKALWTDALFGGMPTFQISPSYASTRWVEWLQKVYMLGFPAPVNLLFIMMVGFFILLLTLRLRWHYALLGAIAWGFSTYFIILIGAGHIWKYLALAYVPPTIAGLVLAYRGRYLAGGALTALFATLQIASNHVQMSYYFLFVMVALAIGYLVRAIREKHLGRWGIATGTLLAAGAIAVAANAPNLYNSYIYAQETMRGGHSELKQADTDANASQGGLDRDYITAWSYGIDETMTLLVPNTVGGASIKPEKGENKPLLLSDTRTAEQLADKGEISATDFSNLGVFYQYFGDQPMTNGPVYVGALIFVLFIFGCVVVKGPEKWALVAVTVFTVMLAWGHNFAWLTNLMIDHFPMYNKFRTPASILVVAEFTMPLLAVLGLYRLLSDPDGFRTYRRPLLWSFGIGLSLCLIMLAWPSLIIGNAFSAMEEEGYLAQGMAQQYPTLFAAVENVRYGMVRTDALRSLIVLLASAGVMTLAARRTLSTGVALGALIVIVGADLFLVNKRYIDHDSFMPKTSDEIVINPRPVDTQILADTTSNYRVLDVQHFSEAAPSYFHRTVGGYHAAKLARYQDIIDRYFTNGINENVINMLNTRWFIYDDNTAVQNPMALGNAWIVDSLTLVDTPQQEIDFLADFNPATSAVADRKFADAIGQNLQPKQPGDTIYLTSYAPDRLTFHATTRGDVLAVFSEIYFPWGWNVTIDGKEAPLARADYILRALRVPAGSHTIAMEFAPRSVAVTETVAKAAIIVMYIIIAAAIAVAILRRKRPQEPSPATE